MKLSILIATSYSGRTYAEGKKIAWRDGLAAPVHIFSFNLLPPARKVGLHPSTSVAAD